MKNQKAIAESTWFTLFGDKLLALAIFLLLFPYWFALRLIHSGSLAIGVMVFSAHWRTAIRCGA